MTKFFIKFVWAKQIKNLRKDSFRLGEQDNEKPYLKYRKIFSSPFQLDCPRLRHSRWMQKWLLSLPAVFSRWGVSTVVPKHALKKSNWINRNNFWKKNNFIGKKLQTNLDDQSRQAGYHSRSASSSWRCLCFAAANIHRTSFPFSCWSNCSMNLTFVWHSWRE